VHDRPRRSLLRRENGGQTTHNARPVPWPVPLGSKAADDAMACIGTLSCSDQLDTHVMDFITRLWLFKIVRGRIVGVEAMGVSLPYGTKSPWAG
jgi:hypothetical protein